MHIEFVGSACFRQRILLSLLSAKPVRIREIRVDETQLGLKDYEVRFLKLMERVTNGTVVEISYTGTDVFFKPGSVYGGSVDFDCGLERSVVYYLEALLVLAPFSKLAFRIKLQGMTADLLDQTIDSWKNTDLRILRHFGVEEGLDFRIHKRGAHPLGGGEVELVCPTVSSLKPISLIDVGQVKRVRGVASTCRVSPQVSGRLVEAAKSKLGQFLSDIYIYSDVSKGIESGRSPGYGLFLSAESTTGAFLTACSVGLPETPAEEIASKTATALLKQIQRGGFFDRSHQWLVLVLMALCPEDLCKVKLSLGEECQELMESISAFLGVKYRVKRDASDGLDIVSCIGSGLSNISRRTQ